MSSCKSSLSVYLPLLVFIFSGCTKAGNLKPLENAAVSGIANVKDLSDQPNIILFLGDDIGYDIPSCNGGESYETPAIDALANEGMRFTQCYSAPLCSASRFELLTGKYNFRNYVYPGMMNPDEKTFATLLKNAGYKTYVAGKWQLDGGDASIHSLGFDDYLVYNPFVDILGSRYKNPVLYKDSNFLTSDLVKGKYGDDLLADGILSFIKSNNANKFFVYYPINNAHDPFSPTPDDPEFAGWNPKRDASDTVFFPSMIKYMDKKIGQIIDSLKLWGLYNNTLVLFAGDNGSPNKIVSVFNGEYVRGGKGHSTVYGTHVPLLATWPGHIAAHSVNKNLVDFSDFLPTLADAASTVIPAEYGTIDGFSFYNQLTGGNYIPRDWIFCHFKPNGKNNQDIYKRWAQTKKYKLYDFNDNFYNIINDPFEVAPLTTLTLQEQRIKDSLRTVIASLH